MQCAWISLSRTFICHIIYYVNINWRWSFYYYYYLFIITSSPLTRYYLLSNICMGILAASLAQRHLGWFPSAIGANTVSFIQQSLVIVYTDLSGHGPHRQVDL